jgi:hypothetical protein
MTERDRMKVLADYLQVTARYYDALRARRVLVVRALAELRAGALRELFLVLFQRPPTEGELRELTNL